MVAGQNHCFGVPVAPAAPINRPSRVRNFQDVQLGSSHISKLAENGHGPRAWETHAPEHHRVLRIFYVKDLESAFREGHIEILIDLVSIGGLARRVGRPAAERRHIRGNRWNRLDPRRPDDAPGETKKSPEQARRVHRGNLSELALRCIPNY
jgi:hypothetical protein